MTNARKAKIGRNIITAIREMDEARFFLQASTVSLNLNWLTENMRAKFRMAQTKIPFRKMALINVCVGKR